jgi:hypothetical protein
VHNKSVNNDTFRVGSAHYKSACWCWPSVSAMGRLRPAAAHKFGALRHCGHQGQESANSGHLPKQA